MTSWTISQAQTVDLVDSGTIREIKIKTAGGAVKVIGQEGLSQASVEVVSVDGPPVLVSAHSGVVRIEQSAPDSSTVKGKLAMFAKVVKSSVASSSEYSCDLVVRVPRGTEVSVATVTAAIDVTGLDRDTSLKTATGAISASDVHRETDLTTVSGAIRVDGISGELDVKTVAGAVVVTDADISDFSADAVNASVDLTLTSAHTKLDVKSVTGKVLCAAPLTSGYDVDVQALRGQVRVADHELPVTSGRRLKVDGDGGLRVRGKMLSGDLIVTQSRGTSDLS